MALFVNDSNEQRGWETLKLSIDSGFSVKELKYLKEKYKFTDESLATLLGVSTRTIFRRKNEQLSAEESTKIYQLVKILNKTEKLMGSPQNCLEWINLKNSELKNYRPIELCTNIVGYEQVMNLLEKMEWGIY